MPAVLHDDLLQRMSLTGSAIKRGTAAFQKHLGALGDMMEPALASCDQLEDMQCPMQVQLSSAYKRRMMQAASEFQDQWQNFTVHIPMLTYQGPKATRFLR